MSNSFKKVIDRPEWVQVMPSPNAHASGVSLATDLRNDVSRNPFIYQLVSNAILNRFNIITKAWGIAVAPSLAGTFGAGAGCIFAPSLALKGSIGAGCSTTSIVTTTAMTAVGVNMLANRGGSGDYGFRVRIIGNSAGGSGKTEERWITGNTGGATPTLLMDTALTFTPQNGDSYEILGGRVFMLGSGTTASNSWRSFEVAANTLSSGLSTTNLPATLSTDFSGLAMDEQYVPFDHIPGEGLVVGGSTYDASGLVKHCLLATASASGTLTGQASSGDAGLVANEYRNFQIRIVEDTGIPTAVGQRRWIASHTGGASPVYTLGAAWSVTPSATCKFVIENPNVIVLWSSATTTTYVYNYSDISMTNGTTAIASGAWSTTFCGARGGAMGAGCTSFPSFGIEPDAAHNARHSFIYSFRGGASSTLDVLDWASGTAPAWTSAIVYDGGNFGTLSTGSCGKYAPHDNEGRFGYLNPYVASALNQIYRFDVQNRVLSPYVPTDWIQSGTAAVGDRVATYCAIDGTDKYSVILLLAHASAIAMELVPLV